MFTTRSAVSVLSVVMMVLGASVASGQNFPTKPIRIYTGSPGGSNDSASRLVASGITGPLGQPVVIENRGATLLAAESVAKAPPDGYSLVLAGDVLWLGPLLKGQTDAMRDFAPISILASAPNILTVHPSLPVKSVKELIALAKARPGELNYSSGQPGGVDHLSAELFKTITGSKMVQITFKGAAGAAISLAGGEVQVMFGGAALSSPYIKAGKFRALAVTSAQPSALAAGLPTLAASGLPGFELVGIDHIFTTAKTPVAVVNRLNEEIVRFLRTKEAQEKYLNLGAEVIASSPEEHVDKLNSRITVIGKVIRDAGIKVD